MMPTPPESPTRSARRFEPRDFANGALIQTGDARRADTEAFIAQIYRARYGAELSRFLPHLLAFRNAAGGLQAAVGLRCGNEGPLFVEQYLDEPAEAAVAAATGRAVPRDQLIEVGNFGALSAGDARELILHLTQWLHLADFRWVLFAATRQLRNAFDRLHLATVELADASASRLTDDRSQWGRYYDAQPKLVFGDIAAGHAYLQRSRRVPETAPAMPWLPCLAAGAL
jgi:Thermostable hemolysin